MDASRSKRRRDRLRRVAAIKAVAATNKLKHEHLFLAGDAGNSSSKSTPDCILRADATPYEPESVRMEMLLQHLLTPSAPFEQANSNSILAGFFDSSAADVAVPPRRGSLREKLAESLAHVPTPLSASPTAHSSQNDAAIRLQAAFRAWRQRKGYKVLRSYVLDLRRHFIAQQVQLVSGLRGSVTAQLVRLGCNDVKRIQISLEVLEGRLSALQIGCHHVPTLMREWSDFSKPLVDRIVGILSSSQEAPAAPLLASGDAPPVAPARRPSFSFAVEMGCAQFLRVVQLVRHRVPNLAVPVSASSTSTPSTGSVNVQLALCISPWADMTSEPHRLVLPDFDSCAVVDKLMDCLMHWTRQHERVADGTYERVRSKLFVRAQALMTKEQLSFLETWLADAGRDFLRSRLRSASELFRQCAVFVHDFWEYNEEHNDFGPSTLVETHVSRPSPPADSPTVRSAITCFWHGDPV